MDDAKQRRNLALLDTVFRPGAPVDREDLFAGRLDQLSAVGDAIGAVGQQQSRDREALR